MSPHPEGSYKAVKLPLELAKELDDITPPGSNRRSFVCHLLQDAINERRKARGAA